MLTRPTAPFFQFAADPTLGLEAPPRFLEMLPVAIYACNRDGRILWFNRKAVELWGRLPAVGELFCGFFKGYVDGREIGRADTQMAKVLRTGMTVDGAEGVIERPDGSRISVMMHIEPVHDERGDLIGAINCFHDTTAARAAREDLRQRQQDLEDFFENGAVALHLVGGDGTILRANQAELDLLGYAREEYVGRNISEFHVDPPVIEDILSRLCASEKLDRYPARLRAKDGAIKHVLITSNVPFREGQFVNARCFTIDVTASKLADTALRERDQRLAATYEHAAIGISEVDADGRRLRSNQAACTIMGHSRERMLQLRVFDSTHPDDRDDDVEQHRKLVAGEVDRYVIEKRYLRGDGRFVWLSVMCTAVRDEAGKFLYSVRVFHDVTETKRTIAALAESEQRLAATYQHAAIAISEIDAEGRLVRVNETVSAILGYSPEELLELTVFDVTHPDDRAEDREQFQHQVGGDAGDYAVEKRLICKDGRVIWVSVASSSVYDSTGRFRHGIRVMQDITARKHAEDRQKALVDELNHRVKNTLATVQSLAVQTLRGSGATTKVRDDFNARLFALSKAHDQLSRAGWESADFESIVEGIFAPYQIHGGDQVRLRGPSVKLPPHTGLLLAMVLHELATNAAKYGALSRAPGTLDLTWAVADGTAGRRLTIDWREAGGPPVKRPERRGFGSRLAERAIAHELKGTAQICFDPAGVHCKFEIPLLSSTA
jgi:PAS domain S-box-containing protein